MSKELSPWLRRGVPPVDQFQRHLELDGLIPEPENFTLNGYQRLARQTLTKLHHDDDSMRILYAGLSEKLAEISAELDAPSGYIDGNALESELGDALWYSAMIAQSMSMDLHSVAELQLAWHPGRLRFVEKTDDWSEYEDEFDILLDDYQGVMTEGSHVLPVLFQDRKDFVDHIVEKHFSDAILDSDDLDVKPGLEASLYTICYIADSYHHELSEIATKNLEKLQEREKSGQEHAKKL